MLTANSSQDPYSGSEAVALNAKAQLISTSAWEFAAVTSESCVELYLPTKGLLTRVDVSCMV